MSFQAGKKFRDCLVLGTLGEVQEQPSALPLPNPADDTHLEFYFEQAGNIQRSFRGKKTQV